MSNLLLVGYYNFNKQSVHFILYRGDMNFFSIDLIYQEFIRYRQYVK